MKFIVKHKFTSLIIVIFVIFVVILFFVYDFFFSAGKNPEYGNRLDGIEAVEIKNDDIDKIISNLKDNKNVESASANISGRTLDIVITVSNDLSVKNAKSIGEKSYEKLADNQIKYYSIQIFIKKSDASKNNFPIIWYKQREKTDVVWTKDREASK